MNLNSFYWIPIFVGFAAVLQAGLNRQIASGWGLSGATFLNATVFWGLAAAFYFSRWADGRIHFSEMKVWYLIPGALGFCLVLGLPYSISKWGAFNTFLWLISSQIVVSALWDYGVEGQEFSWKRLVGGLLAILGAAIAVR